MRNASSDNKMGFDVVKMHDISLSSQFEACLDAIKRVLHKLMNAFPRHFCGSNLGSVWYQSGQNTRSRRLLVVSPGFGLTKSEKIKFYAQGGTPIKIRYLGSNFFSRLGFG
jgi:hypothetical protein